MPQPFSMNVTLTIRPERHEAFLDAMREVLPHARGEEACVYLNVRQMTKTVLITGAGSGFGRLAALDLARLGHRALYPEDLAWPAARAALTDAPNPLGRVECK